MGIASEPGTAKQNGGARAPPFLSLIGDQHQNSCGIRRPALIPPQSAAVDGFVSEQLFDAQRLEIYRYRADVRSEPDALSLVRRTVAEAIQAWQPGGRETLAAGVGDLLTGHPASEPPCYLFFHDY